MSYKTFLGLYEHLKKEVRELKRERKRRYAFTRNKVVVKIYMPSDERQILCLDMIFVSKIFFYSK